VTHWDERASTFECEGDALIAITHRPAVCARRGVLIAVGGPQYRAGSHRQFTLLSRHLASAGIASMRFDYRGMGDSEGRLRSFENVEADIRTAADHFMSQVSEIEEIVLWGLCDAASAALFYAHTDRRVTGLVLLNPWVRTDAGQARAYLRHYYAQRLLQREFWGKALRGRLDVLQSLDGLWQRFSSSRTAAGLRPASTGTNERDCSEALPVRMLESLNRFKGRVLLVLSGNDLTAKEFIDVSSESAGWRNALASERLTRLDLPDANHTFATRGWRDQVADSTARWVRSW
jgi:exosortase A-associated hydrolase 1